MLLLAPELLCGIRLKTVCVRKETIATGDLQFVDVFRKLHRKTPVSIVMSVPPLIVVPKLPDRFRLYSVFKTYTNAILI